jgi:hypothetical protein
MAGSFSARDVLDELDDDARLKHAFFPDFGHGYNYHVDARLTAYGDESRWAIVIEQLHVNPRWGSFAGTGTLLCFHGNCIDLSAESDGGKHKWITLADLMADGPSGPLLPDTWSHEVLLSAKDVRVRGQVVPIRTDQNYYWARRIEVNPLTHAQVDEWIKEARARLRPSKVADAVRFYEQMRLEVGKFKLRSWHLVRGMVPEYRELLLATDAERRRGIPKDLPLLLQVDNWDHPRLLDGELPSSCTSIKQIAKVLAQHDRALWTFEEEEGNVHWSNWPQSGSM